MDYNKLFDDIKEIARRGINDPVCRLWAGETILGSDALEAFQKSIKANSYFFRG